MAALRWKAAAAALTSLTLAALLYSQSAPSTPFVRKWADSSFPIPWRLNVTKGQNIEGTTRELADVVRGAFQSWAATTTALVSFQEGPAIPATDPGRDNINHVSAVPVSYTSGALALTLMYSFSSTGVDQFGQKVEFPGQIVEADIVFNPATLFSLDVTTPSGRIDFESVAAHEIGHLLGLDHTAISSATMFPTLATRVNYGRVPSMADMNALSRLYPSSTFYLSRGGLSGTVRMAGGTPVFGAHVVIADSDGRPVTSAFTDPNGTYQAAGLAPGSYAPYVEPLDGPVSSSSIANLAGYFPGNTAFTSFSTRYAVSTALSTLTISKIAGDNQTGDMGDPLATLLELKVADAGGNPMQGVTVNLSGSSGGANVVPFTGVTDNLGTLRATAYLGTGVTQSITAFAGAAKTTFTATVRAPVLNSLSNNSGAPGASIALTLTGKNFVKNATTISVSGAGVSATAVTVTKPSSVTATFNIDANATAGQRSVTVTTPTGTSSPLTFTVQ